MSEAATKSSWSNSPIDIPEKTEVDLHFTNDQYEKLIRGLIPKQMEDKWFIFYEDGWLNFYRSWTGYGIYRAQLLKEVNGYAIKEFWVERNPMKNNNENENEEIAIFTFLIFRGLLGIDVRSEFINRNIHTGADTIKGWNTFGNLLFTNKGIDYSWQIRSALFGVATGDALGVPVEFRNRSWLKQNPVSDMVGHGTHNQLPGTWSDDSSLTFCLAESLTREFYLNDIANNFIQWYRNNYWSARGSVFDVGNATKYSIERLEEKIEPDKAGADDENSNGNGSLMRILPLVFYLIDKPTEEKFDIIKKVSSLTHRHIRSVISCFYYLEFASQLIESIDKFEIYRNLQMSVTKFLLHMEIDSREIQYFDRLLRGNIHSLVEGEIHSSGYVIHTLEASIWCLMTTDNYRDAVLKAVNLGGDTDTTGAVTGGLAGLLYGYDTIPIEWINILARKEDIEHLALRLANKMMSL